MSMQDPISDLLTVIRNGQTAGTYGKQFVELPSSKLKLAIVKVLLDEGYIAGYNVESHEGKNVLKIELKYYRGKPVIRAIRRVSKPSLRIYKGVKKFGKVLGGLGISIISTPQGVVSNRVATALGQGGEILCEVE